MRKFLLFSYEGYYPSGGWCDFAGSFRTIDDAKKAANKDREYHEIVDIDEEKIILECSGKKQNWKKTQE
jgi:hypothetical protein